MVVFSRFASGPTFSNVFLLFQSFESINFDQFWEQISMKFGSFWAPWVVYAPRGFQIASRLLQDGLLEPIWTQHGPKLAPSWLKLGPCWPQVGSNLAQVGPICRSPASPGPTLAPPDPSLWPLGALHQPSGLPNLQLGSCKTQHGAFLGLPNLQIGS